MDQITIGRNPLDTAATAEGRVEQRRGLTDNRTMCFGKFSVCPGARVLRLGTVPVPLGSRAFDLLIVLLRSRGRLVTKDEIVREVWPSTFVDESNLRFQMGVLRKALGPERDRIKTIPGRGYIFVDNEENAPPAQPQHAVATMPNAASESFIMIVEPDAEERNAMAMLLRALKVSVLSFKSVEEVAAFTVAPLKLTA
ncbi:winged helix-turn-helix domain-containing protein [Sphingomonas endolithica]|uniref:winged helix-turn-helix domain-containing protein n=1 Tax=Sphingomonas endolithica TaxID=2972485 RepID=UPI0021AE6BF6|nr:winged helix-turn-helix domain-containing protein [Sphingomonas sp. ZFBP2030]